MDTPNHVRRGSPDPAAATTEGLPKRGYWPIWELTISRMRVFYREPAAVFWVYGFPLVMAMSLGTAFRDNPKEKIAVDIVAWDQRGKPAPAHQSVTANREGEAPASDPKSKIQNLKSLLASDPRFEIKDNSAEPWQKRLQAGKTDLVIEVNPESGAIQLWDEPHRDQSRLARHAVEAALLRAENPSAPKLEEKHLDQAGSRYIDFLLPGLIGLNLMGGGMWGVGFVIVDMRVRKLLKRFLATPMRRSDFLLAVMCSRLFFTITDIIILLIFGYVMFQVGCAGSYFDLTALILLGGATFAGVGLLVASRVQTIETVSGIMNFVMLPMWILSGVFFSSERFPSEIQPIINALPLTALNQALRGVMLEGHSLTHLWPQLAVLSAYAMATFAIALRVFRWR
jgi:ABC-type multidrug transport system permease subunit